MKQSFRTLLVPAVLSLGLFAACNKAESAAADIKNQTKSAVEQLDITKLSGDALKNKVSSTFTELTTSLGNIKDEVSAKDLVAKFGPAIDSLSGMKSKLAGMMPDSSVLTKAISSVTEKFKGNDAVMKVLQPLLDKIGALLK